MSSPHNLFITPTPILRTTYNFSLLLHVTSYPSPETPYPSPAPPHPSPAPPYLSRPLSPTSSNWELCAKMFATFEDTPDPAKFKMKYWGAATHLQTGGKSMFTV